MKQLTFVRFAYQIVANGQPVLVFDCHADATNYVTEHLKGAEVIILPVAVFAYH